MTRNEYIGHLRAIYLIANMADSDNPDRPDWLQGHEMFTHCRPLDQIAREMSLGDNWLEDHAAPGPDDPIWGELALKLQCGS